MELNRREYGVEVVNGGVEGYGPRNILLRIAEFKALHPEITTIFIGWNPIYSPSKSLDQRKLLGWEEDSYTLRIIKAAYHRAREIVVGTRELALEEFRKSKAPDRYAPAVQRLDDYAPAFIEDVERIIQEMQSVGSRVLLITLPGLYTMEEEPSDLALEKGHLPPYTENPYVLAKAAERYNIALRNLAM